MEALPNQSLESQFAVLIESDTDMTVELAMVHNNILTDLLDEDTSLTLDEAYQQLPGLEEIVRDHDKPLFRFEGPEELTDYIFKDPRVTDRLERNKQQRTVENAIMARSAMYLAALRWFLEQHGYSKESIDELTATA